MRFLITALLSLIMAVVYFTICATFIIFVVFVLLNPFVWAYVWAIYMMAFPPSI